MANMAKKVIDAFMASDSWFRAIVIRKSHVDIERFGKADEPFKLKWARLYKRFAELLISNNTQEIFDGRLFVDQIRNCNEDEFVEIMKQEFCFPFGKHSKGSSTPTLKDIRQVKSHLDQYQLIQVTDLLMGCILNNLLPTKTSFKNDFRQHLITRLGVRDLLPSTWGHFSRWESIRYCSKYTVWYWQPK